MTKGNVGSLLVFDPEKITIDQPIKEASGDAVVGIVTERGRQINILLLGF
jgi:hypothetical protein